MITKVDSLIDGQNFIALEFDNSTGECALNLNGNKFHSDTYSNKPMFNGVELATGAALGALEGVKGMTYNESTSVITVTFHDAVKPDLVIRVPTMDIIDGVRYDAPTKHIMFKRKDGTEFGVDVAHLIDIYHGLPGAQVSISINPDTNEISATLNLDSVDESFLTPAVRERLDEIDNKINKVSGAVEGNIPLLHTDGSIYDSGQSISELEGDIGNAKTEIINISSTLVEIDNRVTIIGGDVEELKEKFEDHDHDGENSKRIEYFNLASQPVRFFGFPDEIVPGNGVSQPLAYNGAHLNIEYVIEDTVTSCFLTGVLKSRHGLLLEFDRFDNTEHADAIDVSLVLESGSLMVTNNGVNPIRCYGLASGIDAFFVRS